MLSSIHPFGERSRNNTFRRTASAHVFGSVVGGIALGLVFGLIGLGLNQIIDLSSTTRTSVVLAAAIAALAIEASGRERLLPSRTRQVNENWIQQYRGWVYAGGFGAELGFGISTIITTPLVHLLVISIVLVGTLPAALLLGATFGFVRGATVLFSRGVDTPDELRAFHRRLDDLRSRSRSGAVAALVLTSAVGVTGLLT